MRGKRTRAEKERERERRRKILKRIDELLEDESMGIDVSEELKNCGYELGADEIQEWKPDGVSEEDYLHFMGIAKQNDIPVNIYKNRLRKGRDPEEAATMPYYKKPPLEDIDKKYIAIAAKNGISRNTYDSRISRGWDKMKAATKPIIVPGESKKPTQ